MGILCNGTTLSFFSTRSLTTPPPPHTHTYPPISSTTSDWCVPWLRQALKPLTSLIYRDEKGELRCLSMNYSYASFQRCPHSTVIVFHRRPTNLPLHSAFGLDMCRNPSQRRNKANRVLLSHTTTGSHCRHN